MKMRFALAKATLTAVAMTLGLLTGFGAQSASAVTYYPSVGEFTYIIDNASTYATVLRYDGTSSAFTIPSSVSYSGKTYPVTEIAQCAFCYKGLTSVTIPSSVTSIGNLAFSNNLLTTVTIPSSVTSIGYAAFQFNNLTSITIPSSVTSIGYSAFYFNKLTSVTIPSGVSALSDNVFGQNKLVSITIPANIYAIGAGAFSGNLLTTVTIPSGVTTIGSDAFNSNQLTSVTIASGVTSIGSAAFWINSLTSVTIPSSVTSIGSYAFGRNDSLSTVLFLGDAPTVTAAGYDGSFGEASAKTLLYLLNASGFSPSWNGYNASSNAPIISGTSQVGQTLTANPGTWADGTTLAYAWRQVGSDTILGVGNTYTALGTDQSTNLTVTITAVRAGFTSSVVTSPSSATVTSSTFTSTPTPTITGTKVSGSLLTAVTTGWVPSSGVTFTYVWNRARTATGVATTISGATNSTYRLTTADRGKYITVTVTARATGYVSTTKTSAGGATLIAR